MIKNIFSDDPIETASTAIVGVIKKHIFNGERVLWLLSGGSGEAIAINASKKLSDLDLSKLFVSMTDERYGEVGHKDENWQQLLNAGLQLPGANLYRPLKPQNIEDTTAYFNNWLSEQLKKADYKIGIFGLGADGHTAGIKPHSPAVDSPNLAASFTGDDFERITITFNVIKQLDEIFIQAYGDSKKSAIDSLLHKNISLDDQPAQVLKQVPIATIYTNNKEIL